jgi:hypothetical protein
VLGHCCCGFDVKSVTLAFEGLSTEGAKINLAAGALCGGFDYARSGVTGQPIGPLEARLL